jgi:DNA-binding transcriptional ArsR family regulator
MSANSLDECLDTVGDQSRRDIIRELRSEHGGETTLERLAERFEHEEGGRVQAAIALHHHHLPKLAATGVVEYDSDSGVVLYRLDEAVEGLLDQLPDEPRVAKQ